MSSRDDSMLLPTRRESKVHMDEQPTALASFRRLPDEIIEQILHICDPNTFASLIVLNRTWRRVSQQPHLYIYHLSHCRIHSGYPDLTTPAIEEQLPLLRAAFAKVVKRNLFEAYLRPHETTITLVSNSTSSSSAFPGGEAFHFSFSPNGHYVLAYSSSRIYVIRTVEQDLAVKRELKILRRPASVTILDDGSLLAVLSTDHQVDIYDLTGGHPKHVRAVGLDNPPRTIALSPTGSVMAAAYDGGVEVYSLASSAVVTDRRAVKCDAADSLSFSLDGTQLIGTTLQAKNPSTVILTAPYYDPGDLLPEDAVSHLWTTSIIFPNSSRDCSHAVLLPSPSDDESSWTFTYDRVFETFRAVRIDDLRNGTTYFTGPVPDVALFGKLLPSTLPTATACGDLVAAGFQGKEIWLYGIPENLDYCSDSGQATNNTPNSADDEAVSITGTVGHTPSLRASHTWPRDPTSNNSRIPQWQLLCDKSRNRFVEGRKISSLEGISALKWITGRQSVDLRAISCSERLMAVAPGVVNHQSDAGDESLAPVDGGRISILDFKYLPSGGKQTFLTIEVGENEPEVLEEEHRDIETEVAIVRRRTVAQKRVNQTHALRSATVATRPAQSTTSAPAAPGATPPLPPLPTIETTRLATTGERPETASIASLDEEQEELDAPYAHGAPRSGTTLRRAATAAAINRRLHPPRVVAQEHIEYRRADGREEHPHESDADNWVPPPPPYSREPVAPLPEHLRNAVLAGSVLSPTPSTLHRSNTTRSSSSAESNIVGALHRSRTTYLPSTDTSRQQPRYSPRRTVSDTITLSSSSDSFDESRQHTPQLASVEFDPLYDVSPPGTPPQQTVQSASTVPSVPPLLSQIGQIPRRPVGLGVPGRPTLDIAQQVTMPPQVSPILQSVVPISSSETNTQRNEVNDFDSANHLAPNTDTSRPSTGSASLTQTRLDAPVPPRPNDDHRIIELPPSVPEQQTSMAGQSQAFPPSDETPLSISPLGTVKESIQPSLDLPSASQLARLNSRAGRPRVLTDPSRRNSGGIAQSQFGSPSRQDILPRRVPVPNTTIRIDSPGARSFTSPESPYNSYRSPNRSPISYSPTRNYSPSHRSSLSNGNQRLPRRSSASSQDLRPRMQRLDTIHSVTSDAGPPIGPMKSHGIFRKPSRAERSAAINIQQAKERGWRGTVRKDRRKTKNNEGTSSAGWTNVSKDSFGEKDKKGTKCVVM